MDAFSTTNERLTMKCDDGAHLSLSMILYRIAASEPASDAARELFASSIRYESSPEKMSSILIHLKFLVVQCTELSSDLPSVLCAYRAPKFFLRGLYD